MSSPPTISPTPIPLTQARVRLFHIVDAVLSGETPRVFLSHRDRDAAVVLIAATELEAMERDLAALRAQVGVGPLRGLAALNKPAEEIVSRVREQQRDLAAQKLSYVSDATDVAEKPSRAAERRPPGYRARRKRS